MNFFLNEVEFAREFSRDIFNINLNISRIVIYVINLKSITVICGINQGEENERS